MVSVTSTQNAAAQQPPQNTNQTDLQKMIARVAALKQRMDARNSATNTSVRPDTTNDPINKASADIARFVAQNQGEVIWTRAAGFSAESLERTPGAVSTYTPPTASTPTFGVTSADNVGKGGEMIKENGGNFSGGAGNDTILAGYNSIIHGGDGNDYIRADGKIYGGKGNDEIEATGDVYGGEGDDTIRVRFRESTAYGGAGNDRISVAYGGSDVEGGTGNDLINVRGSRQVSGPGETTDIRFNLGDGKDIVQVQHSDIVLELGEGFTLENIKINYSDDGRIALLTFINNDVDQIEVRNMDNSSTQDASTFIIQFADGNTLELDEFTLENPAQTYFISFYL
ncbi:MAG: hypothetical protein JKY83_13955 [Rhizobiaceae bacterium]|nr:hypothetical protein [Rhizobiaceae bacterium]